MVVLLSLALFVSCAKSVRRIDGASSSQGKREVSNGLAFNVPVSIAPEDCIFIEARINNSKPLWFILDSGSGGLLINSKLVKTLNLRLEEKLDVGGAGEKSVEAQIARGINFEFTGGNIAQQTAVVVPLNELEEDTGHEVAGIIGFPLLSRYVVEIDFDSQKINVYDPQRFQYQGQGEIIPLSIEYNMPHVRARIDLPGHDELEGNFLIDTGAVSVASMLTRPFTESNKLLKADYKTLRVPGNRGMGGEVKMSLGRAQKLEFGRFAFSSPVIGFFQSQHGFGASEAVDGLIGDEILRRFKVIFDYSHQRMILEPNAHYDEPFESNMGGFHLRGVGDPHKTLKVHDVMINSAASEAGLRDEDEIVSVDNQSAQIFTVPQLYQMFKQEGREYTLGIKRGNELLKLKLKLRRLV
jgi:hypothetical protein